MKDYIEIEGKKWRCLICWNTIAAFCETKKIEDLSKIDNIAKLSARDVLIMLYWALYYGADSEGKEFPYKMQQLGNLISAVTVTEFVKIFAKQMKSQIPADNTDQASEEPTEQKKRKFLFFK